MNIAGALIAINSTSHVLRRIKPTEIEINDEIAVAVATNYGTELRKIAPNRTTMQQVP